MPGLIEYDFIKHVVQLQDHAFNNREPQIISELSKFFALLKAISIRPATTKEQLQEILEKKIQNKDLSHEEMLLLDIYKNVGGRIDDLTNQFHAVEDFNGFYFLKSQKGKIIEKNYGVVCKGHEFDGSDFYKDATETNLPFKKPSEITKCAVPSNAAIIVDPYLFKGKGKLDYLIELLKTITPKCGVDYHLTIITTSLKQSFNKTQQKLIWTRETEPYLIQSGVEKLANAGYYVQAFVINQDENFKINYGRKRDRKILTNYTTISIGHPFEKDETYFSQQFLGGYNDVERIKSNYDNFRKEIDLWRKIIASVPRTKDYENFKNEQLIFYPKNQTPFTNRIFENLA